MRDNHFAGMDPDETELTRQKKTQKQLQQNNQRATTQVIIQVGMGLISVKHSAILTFSESSGYKHPQDIK